MNAEAISFGSERYFQVLRDNPELGRYLSLGDRVTVVLAGKAYAVGAEGQSGARPAPAATVTAAPASTVTTQATRIPATPAGATARVSATPAAASTPVAVAQNITATPSVPGPAAPADPTQAPITVCGLPLVGLLGALVALVAFRRTV